MQYLAKLLKAIKQDSKLFKSPELNFILGLTTSQVKELKKTAITEGLISPPPQPPLSKPDIESAFVRQSPSRGAGVARNQFVLTKAGEQYINEVPIVSWVDDVNPKRPEINLEYLKPLRNSQGEFEDNLNYKTPPTVTKAIRCLARHLLEGEDLKENSTEHYLVRELLCSKSTCAKIKKEIEKFVLQNNRFKLTCLFERFITPPYGLTKSIISVLLLDVLFRNKDVLAIYENGQFQLKLTALMFDRMVYCPQNFELQKTVIEDLPILEKISAIILPCKSSNILDLTKGLIYFIKNLDKYTLTTERLSKNTIRFRNAVLNAKDPINLFYKDIPKILDDKILCQCDKTFVKAFDEAIRELQSSYTNLIKEINEFLINSFKVGRNCHSADKKHREKLAKRFEAVQEFLSDNELKILHNNIKELNSPDTLWIERIATFINKSRVPKDWSDNDVADFKLKVKELALKFTTIEATAGVKDLKLDSTLIKVLDQISKFSKPQKMVLVREIVGGN